MNDLKEFEEFFIDRVRTRIKILKKRDPNKLYLAKELCADFWELFNGLHPTIGKFIKTQSDIGKLPIEAKDRTSSNAWLYRIK